MGNILKKKLVYNRYVNLLIKLDWFSGMITNWFTT